MIEHIKANAEMAVHQLRPISGMDFGYSRESVEWLEGYIERMRLAGEFQTESAEDKLTSVFGSFLGECIVRCYGGAWTLRDGVWCIAFDGDNYVFPFAKVSKQMEHGLEDGIGSLFRALPAVFKGLAYVQPPRTKG